jgi:acetylglutamate kinase
MGCLMKLWREYRMSGDRRMLARLYPHAKRALEYAWKEWDKDQDGVMEGIQHNTYDIEFLGPNTMMGTLFMGGLRAMEEIAKELGEPEGTVAWRLSRALERMRSLLEKRGVGLSGSDGNLILAKKMEIQKVEVGGVQKDVDLGHVGEIERIDPALLNTLLDTQYIPVVAPIAIDRFGGSLNINADTAAGDIAVALKAYKLVNMTDVDGVMDKGRTKVFRKLTIDDANKLVKTGAIGEGMIPKVGSVIRAVENGVSFSHIINGNVEHNLILELFTRDGVGTMISLK